MPSVEIHDCVLNNGAKMPAVGIGCWMGQRVDGMNQDTYDMVAEALKTGYRHIDTASGYGNEEAVGKAIRDSGIPREKIFVTTKLTGKDHGRVAEGFEGSFKALNVGYIDLYLMHWPQATDPETSKTLPKSSSPTFNETWAEMEKLLGTGKCKSIGVSNFSVKNLGILLETASTVPAVDQVESHLYLPQMSLDKYCKEKGIVLTAYSPLGQPKPGTGVSPVLKDPLVIRLAEKYGTAPGTILISWVAQRPNWNVIPKSVSPARIKANFEIVKLDQEDFDALLEVHTAPGKLMHLCDYGGVDIMAAKAIFGWSLEDMGWEKMD